MIIFKWFNLTSLFLAMALYPYASNAALQALSEISETAENFVKNQLAADVAGQQYKTTIKTGHLDPRLRLRQCDTPLSAEPLSQRQYSNNVTVTVRCDAPKPWTVYVPVKVKTLVPVMVASRPLARGIDIQESDIMQVERELSRLASGYFKSKEPIIGRPAKRILPQGAVIKPNDIAMEKLIRRGNRVSIVTESAGFSVRMPGKALSDAGKGDVIQVENLSSKRMVEGIVLAPGIVKVPM